MQTVSHSRDVVDSHDKGSSSSDDATVTPPTTTTTTRDELMALDAERRTIEQRIADALAYLASTPVGDMEGALVDADGYPRADCDLYAIRTARQTVNCSRNDLRAVQQRMYDKLAQLHEETRDEAERQMRRDADEQRARAAAAAAAVEAAETAAPPAQQQAYMAQLPAFLTITSADEGGPAYTAGLRVGMTIVQFGDVNADTLHASGTTADAVMQTLAQVTRAHEGAMLSVWVRDDGDGGVQSTNVINQQATRQSAVREVVVVPQRWPGSGLLGCAFDLLPTTA